MPTETSENGSTYTTEHFDTVEAVQTRARALLEEGFVVLQAMRGSHAWVGYSAFKRNDQDQIHTVYTLEFNEPLPKEGDPQAIYSPEVRSHGLLGIIEI